MEKSKLAIKLRSLSRKEFRSFALFVKSPFFSQHQETMGLFDILEPYYPAFGLSDQEACRLLNPLNPPDLPRLRVLRSYLIALVDDFLIQGKLKDNESFKMDLLVQSLTEKGFYKEALKVLEEQKEKLDARGILDIQDSYAQHRFWIALLDLRLRVGNKMPELGIGELLTSLDIYFIATRLKYLCTFVSQTFHLSIDLPEDLIRETLVLYGQFETKEMPVVGIYFHLLNLLLGESHLTHYKKILDQLNHYQNHISKDEQVNFFGFLQNYLTARYQKGESGALKEMLDLYKMMIDLDLLFGRGDFSTHSFRNISVIGARLGDFQWVRNFIDKHADRLPEKVRETARNYSSAYLNFSEEKYGEALRQLQTIKFIDPFYRTGHQVLLLRIYFETNDTEAFFSLVNTFRRFLNRNKTISDSHREASLNFISLVRSLMAAKHLSDNPLQKEVNKLGLKMETDTFLTDRTWLKLKLKELG